MRRVCFFPAHSSFFSSHSTDRSSLCVIVNNGFRGSRAPEMPQRFVISSCIENFVAQRHLQHVTPVVRETRGEIYIYIIKEHHLVFGSMVKLISVIMYARWMALPARKCQSSMGVNIRSLVYKRPSNLHE